MELKISIKQSKLQIVLACVLALVCYYYVSLSGNLIANSNNILLHAESINKSASNMQDSIKLSISNTPAVTHNWADTSQFESSAKNIINATVPANTFYFSSTGNDMNSGLDPQNPKKNPTDYFRKGNCTILLKSGDIFTLNYNIAVGSNVKASTYDGSARAVINWVPVNSSPFHVHDAEAHIYYASIDDLTDSHYKISWIKINGQNDVTWHKVFNYSDLSKDMDFFSDPAEKKLYVKSNKDLSNQKFAFASNAGGITIKDSANVIFDNLEIVGGGLGINMYNVTNVVIQNCFLHHIGGIEKVSTVDGHNYRYGNGINIWADNVHNIFVSNNYVSDCFDAGITPQISGSGAKPSDSIFIYNNYVDRCLYNIEFYENIAEKTVPLSNVYIQNNVLTNATDITGGYRYATYGFTSYFCAWHSNCEKSSFTVTNNLGYGTHDYACSFFEPTPPGVYNIADNSLFVLGKGTVADCIKNYEYYTGSESQIIPVAKTVTINNVEAIVASYTSKFNKTNLFFNYLESALK